MDIMAIEIASTQLTNEQGKYTVLADVYTKDGDKITCLKAQVQFTR